MRQLRTIQSEIVRHGLNKEKQQENQTTQPKQVKPKLSKREIEEIMGVHRDTFKRVRGSIRRK